ncbi:hypothetical protein MRX96_009018 [Rhipicephalus microplus]
MTPTTTSRLWSGADRTRVEPTTTTCSTRPSGFTRRIRTARLQMRRMVREGTDPFGGHTTRCDYDFILIRLECLNENVLELSESTSSDRAVD